jgi:hypothetical protein
MQNHKHEWELNTIFVEELGDSFKLKQCIICHEEKFRLREKFLLGIGFVLSMILTPAILIGYENKNKI